MKKLAFFGVIVLFALFGSTFTLTKLAMEQTTISFLLGLRMLVAGIGLITYSKFIQKQKLMVDKQQIFWVAALSMFSFLLCNLFEFWGLQYLSSSKACFIYGLTPFITAGLSFLIFNEKLSFRKFIGMVVGIMAFLPTLVSSEASENTLYSFGIFSMAEISLVAATTFAVLGWLVLKKIGQKNVYSIPMMNGQAMFLCGIISLLISFFIDKDIQPLVHSWPQLILWTSTLIIISNFVCYNLYGILLRQFSATFMSLAGFLTPLFAALWGFIFLNESVGWSFYYSLGLVGLALFIFYSAEIFASKTKTS